MPAINRNINRRILTPAQRLRLISILMRPNVRRNVISNRRRISPVRRTRINTNSNRR